eukprot:gene25200-32877_t
MRPRSGIGIHRRTTSSTAARDSGVPGRSNIRGSTGPGPVISSRTPLNRTKQPLRAISVGRAEISGERLAECRERRVARHGAGRRHLQHGAGRQGLFALADPRRIDQRRRVLRRDLSDLLRLRRPDASPLHPAKDGLVCH